MAEAAIVAGANNRILYANRAAQELLGWPDGALIGEPLTVIQPPRLRAAHLASFQRFVETGVPTIMRRPLRVPALRYDGTEVEIDLRLGEATLDGQRVVIGTLTDLSE